MARYGGSIRSPQPGGETGMVFLIDTREKLPYPLEPSKRVKLDQGDYSVEGLQDQVAIERKTLSDFIGSITQGRKRFFRELHRFDGYDFAAIVVEGTIPDIMKHKYRSKVHPNSVMGTAAAIMVRGVQIVFAGDRNGGQQITERLLRHAWRKLKKEDDHGNEESEADR